MAREPMGKMAQAGWLTFTFILLYITGYGWAFTAEYHEWVSPETAKVFHAIYRPVDAMCELSPTLIRWRRWYMTIWTFE